MLVSIQRPTLRVVKGGGEVAAAGGAGAAV
jgi:hypothetical protein